MAYKPSDTYYKEFTTRRVDTFTATNADSTPVATANRNGIDDAGFVLTVTNLDTGRYKVVGAIPSGYVSGDTVNITVAATVNTISDKLALDSFVLDSKRLSDLQDLPASGVWAYGTRTLSAFSFTVNANVTQIAGQTASAATGVVFPSSIGTSVVTRAQITGGNYALNTDASGNVKLSAENGAIQVTLASGAVSLSDAEHALIRDTYIPAGLVGAGLTPTRLQNLDNLDVTVGSRLSTEGYVIPDDTDLHTILNNVALLLTRADVPTSSRLATSGYASSEAGNVTAILGQVNKLQFDANNNVRSVVPSGNILRSGDIANVVTAIAAMTVEDSESLVKVLRYLLAMATGKISGIVNGAGTTIRVRDKQNTKDRIVLEVDQYGNRSAVTLNGS